MRCSAVQLLACALCLDLAHRSSVDAFLPAPTVLRGSLRPGRSATALLRAPREVAQRTRAIPSRQSRCRLLSTNAIFGGSTEIDIEVPTFFPAVERVIAIGDVHGDVDALIGCLKLSKLIDDDESWIGGKTHLVQLGDILDRGDGELNCMDLLFKLRKEAREAGGQVHILLGNHEVMNVDLDFRYVTPNAWEGWGEPPKSGSVRLDIQATLAAVGFPAYMKQRVQAFRPGGTEAKRLAKMPVAIVIGDTLLVHGGLRKKHFDYGLERMNKEMAAWLEGAPRFKGLDKPEIIDDSDSPIWARLYSVPTPKFSAEKELEAVLKALNVQRMVVGHTPQLRGINAFVTEDGYEVWRTDTGMSSGMMSGPLEVLEVLSDGTLHVLTQDGVVPAALRMPEVEGEFMDVCDIDTNICAELPAETAEIDTSLLSDAAPAGAVVKVNPGEELVNVIPPVEASTGLSEGNQAEVILLRKYDDSAQAPEKRLTILVERLIVDAIQRQDENLTKKTVKEMLKKVVGIEMVDDFTEYISMEIDRIIASDVAELVAKFMREDSRQKEQNAARVEAAQMTIEAPSKETIESQSR